MPSMSISGVVSGMDWDSMIDEIISAAAKPAQVQVTKRTDLKNKKTLYEEMKVLVQSIQSSLTPLKLPSTYKAKDIDIERVDSNGSYKKVLNATVNADAEVNVYDIIVNQIATAQTNRSKQITASTLASTLSTGGITSPSTMYITAGGQRVGIDVYSTDSLQALKSRINNTIKTLDTPMNLTASIVDNKLILQSDNTGLGITSSSATTRYTGSSSIIPGMAYDDTGSISVRSGNTTYTLGKDYEIVNGNEIRWIQYDRGNEVALGDSMNVNYTMTEGDVYQVTGTYGEDEAKVSGFDLIDGGTLGSRTKIVDADGNTYRYGTDFTIKAKKVVWLDNETSSTSEPSSYTVTFSSDVTSSYSSGSISKSTVSTTSTNEPEAYTVKYQDTASGTYSTTVDANGGHTYDINLDFETLSDLYSKTTGGETLSLYQVPGTTAYCLDPSSAGRSAFTITSGGQTYEYGKDFVIRTKDNTTDTSNGNWQITFGRTSTATSTGLVVGNYASNKGITGTALNAPDSGTISLGYAYNYDYSLTGKVNASDNDKTISTVFGTDIENFDSSKLAIRGYTNGTDFTATQASDNQYEITWTQNTTTSPSRDDSFSDFSDFEAAYREAYGLDDNASLPTVTLTDANGTLRTYLNPADTSDFTMTSGGNTYEYGRDYVIRVNDDRNGYVFSWAISGDANSDGTLDINDADTAVTTYTSYKGLTTYGMLASPGTSDTYNFSFSKDNTITASAKVTSSMSDSDKTLDKLFDLDSLAAQGIDTSSTSWMDSLTIKGSDGTEYSYGKDYTIDTSSMQIVWIDKTPSKPDDTTTFTVTYSETNTYSSDEISAASRSSTGEPQSTALNIPYGTDYMSFADASAIIAGNSNAFYVKDSDGNSYSYGTDFTLAASSSTNNSAGNPVPEIQWISSSMSSSATYTVYCDETVEQSQENLTIADDADYDVRSLGIAEITDDVAENISITDANGVTYTHGIDFTINSSGTIHWLADDVSSRPADGSTYTLSYEAITDLTASTIYNGASTQNIYLTVDSGSGKYDDSNLSYEQILSDTGLKASSSDSSFAEYFTLNDGSKTYSYGTDYRIVQGSNTDSTTGQHNTMIEWISGGTVPADSASLTLSYSGRSSTHEVLSTSVERSASDTINPDTSNLVTHKYADWSKAQEIRITDGKETFLLGTDFTLAADRNGDTTIVWKQYDTPSNPDYSTAFKNATSTTVTSSDGTKLSGYRITYEDNDNVIFSMDDGSILSSGTYTLTAKKGSQTKTFTLTSYGSAMTLSGTLDYENDFEGATFTLTDSNDAEITGYSISYGGSGKAAFSMNDGSILDEGTYTVKTVKNGRTTLYDLVSDGNSMTLQSRSSLWETQDNSNAGTYNIYVTTNGVTQTYTGTRPANSYDFTISNGAVYPSLSDLQSGTTTITQGSKTFYEGVDYTFGTDDDGNSTVEWITGEDGYEWYYPASGSMYNINYTSSDGSTATYTAMRSNRTVLNMRDLGMTTASGSISVQYGDGLSLKLDTAQQSEGNTIRAAYSVDVSKGDLWTAEGAATAFTFNWRTPTLTPKSNMPSYGSEVEIEYEYTQNTFSLDDDCGGDLLTALGLNDEENITEAHNAILEINGEEYQRDSNNIGESYGNELIKGMTLNLKGTGEVSIDVFQDAEKAVEGINTFMENYNSLMNWMNTRMTESEVDKDTASTIDSDDFRMRWGLLHGDALLRQTKSQMRNLMAQTFTYSFTQRDSASELYGTLANNGLSAAATLRLRIGGTYMDLTLLPTYTLEDVVNLINDSTNEEMRNNFYDESGKLRDQPLLKASIENDKLVLTSTSNDGITLSGTSAMKALKLNYTYTGLFQLGLSTTSTDYGKSGELEFDEGKFMEALEDNPDEVQEMMLMFASNMDSWAKSMLTTSASGETAGTLTRRIQDIDTRIASIDEYLEKYQDRLDRQEEALRTKYAAAEQTISRLSQQASSIAAILNQLNGYTNNNNSSSS